MTKCPVIIPVFNQASLTAQCLQAILGRDACETIVVDDGSTDSTPRFLAGLGSRIKVVTHAVNSGFAKSCNDGAAEASGDYLVFLNNDTIPQPGWLEALVRYADRHPQAAIVGSKLLFPNGTVQHAGVVICQDRHPRHIYTGFPSGHSAVSKSRRFQIVTAASMLVRRDLFERFGGFDTAFRNGLEDVDLCLRLGEGGYEIHYCAESVLYHYESASAGRFDKNGENVRLYRRRWLDRVRPDDLRYYAEDGLLSVGYKGSFPIHVRVSPLLGTVDTPSRTKEAEQLLAARTEQVAHLTSENTRLRIALSSINGTTDALQYDKLREQVREVVRQALPSGATVLVISKGDQGMLELDGRTAWHFPQTDRGDYAGHHPADSATAIAHLETLRAKGGRYLLIPNTAFWWLEFYEHLRTHLDTHHARIWADAVCVIYELFETQGQTHEIGRAAKALD
jgi:GT2 family glycosyltransferase